MSSYEKEDKKNNDVLRVDKRHIQNGQQNDHEIDEEIKDEG